MRFPLTQCKLSPKIVNSTWWKKFGFTENSLFEHSEKKKQECILVGCVPSAAVAILGGVCLRGLRAKRGVCLEGGMSAQGGCLPRGLSA